MHCSVFCVNLSGVVGDANVLLLSSAICPDNDVDWETDRKRMIWTQGDIVYERQPMSRWRDEYKDEAKKVMDEMKL